jgi:hypothetical protein
MDMAGVHSIHAVVGSPFLLQALQQSFIIHYYVMMMTHQSSMV